MTLILLEIVVSAVLAGLFAVGIKRLFPRRGDWLPVLSATFLPPLIVTIYALFQAYRALIEIGLKGRADGGLPNGPWDVLTTAIWAYLFFAGIWLIVASPSAFLALHLARRK